MVHVKVVMKQASDKAAIFSAEHRLSDLLEACANSMYNHGQGSTTLLQCIGSTMYVLVSRSRLTIQRHFNSCAFATMALLRTSRTL
jgi:hypothetical protein